MIGELALQVNETRLLLTVALVAFGLVGSASAAPVKSGVTDYLTIGRFRPAFDHLILRRQIDSVAASGCTVAYADIGDSVYNGLLAKAEMRKILDEAKTYCAKGHSKGVPVMLSYLCATSIVHADTFTKNWKDYAPGLPDGIDANTLMQQDINGANLPSWYGAPYNPADMWNPVWRQYQRFLIRSVVEGGFDGVFYDNPTVHPSGNYSQHAMRAWSGFLKGNGVKVSDESVSALRELTKSNQRLWLQFRAGEAADFFREMRDYGRSIKPGFILTANNSLNVWDSFYSQPRAMGYSIFQQSQALDFITVEDMSMSPRRDGATHISYAPTLKMIHAIGHGKPISACTIAPGNYITPPTMMQLAIAECAANDAAYMVWACWDEQYRKINEQAVRQYHDFMGKHPDLFGETAPVSDVALIWPYERWLERDDCPTAYLAQSLSAGNAQYDAIAEDDLTPAKLARYRIAVWAAGEAPLKPKTQRMLSSFGGKTFEVPTAKTLPVSLLSSDGVPRGQDLGVVFDGKHFSTEDAEREKLQIADHRTIGAPDNTFTSAAVPAGEHWVSRLWEAPQTVGKIVIWWAGKDTWPKRYEVRGIPGYSGGWRSAKSQREEIVLDKPEKTTGIQVVIGEGGGPNSMSIQEIEVYGPDSDKNLALLADTRGPEEKKLVDDLNATASVSLKSVPGVRTSARKTSSSMLLHLYNLNVIWQDAFHDKVEPAGKVGVSWLLPKGAKLTGLKLQCFTPDTDGYSGNLPFTKTKVGDRTRLDFTVPSLHIWSVIRAECKE